MALDAEDPLEVDPWRDERAASAASPSSASAPPPVVVVQYRTRRLPWILLALLLLAVPLGAYVMYRHMLSRIRDYAAWGARNEIRRVRDLEEAAAKLVPKPSLPVAASAESPQRPDEKSDPKTGGPGPVPASKPAERPALAEGPSSVVENVEKPGLATPRPASGSGPASIAPAPASVAPVVAVAAPPGPDQKDRFAEFIHDLVPEEEKISALEFGGTATQLGGKSATAPASPSKPPTVAEGPVPAPAAAPAPSTAPGPAAPNAMSAPAAAPPVAPLAARTAALPAPLGPSPFDPAEEAPLPPKEEIERQIQAEAAAKEAELRRRTLDKSREIQHAMHEERLRFHKDLREILAVNGDQSGRYIDELCRRYDYQASPQRFHRARLAWDNAGGSLTKRARMVRSYGLPETVILSFIEKDLDPLIGKPGGPRDRNEVRMRAARTFLKRCKPPGSESSAPAKRSSGARAPGAVAAPRGRRSP